MLLYQPISFPASSFEYLLCSEERPRSRCGMKSAKVHESNLWNYRWSYCTYTFVHSIYSRCMYDRWYTKSPRRLPTPEVGVRACGCNMTSIHQSEFGRTLCRTNSTCRAHAIDSSPLFVHGDSTYWRRLLPPQLQTSLLEP